MKRIPATLGYEILVDDEDYERLSQYRWYAHNSGGRGRCEKRPARRTGVAEGRKVISLVHHIIKPPAGLVVDHINGDPWDNRRAIMASAVLAVARAKQPDHGSHQSTVARGSHPSGARRSAHWAGALQSCDDRAPFRCAVPVDSCSFAARCPEQGGVVQPLIFDCAVSGLTPRNSLIRLNYKDLRNVRPYRSRKYRRHHRFRDVRVPHHGQGGRRRHRSRKRRMGRGL